MEVKINVKKNKDFINKISFYLLIVLVIFLVYLILGNFKKNNEDNYYAVYLRTGDLYFGKISWFPKFSLTDVWFLQRATDNTGQVGFSLVRFKEAVYQPIDRIEINKDNVVWVSKLDKDSQLIKEIKARKVSQSPLPTSVISNQQLPSQTIQSNDNSYQTQSEENK